MENGDAALNYKEIFGAVSACSIPFLDLPPARNDRDFASSSSIDYSDVFGGDFSDDLGVSFEEIFGSKSFSGFGRGTKGVGGPTTSKETKIQVGSSSNGICRDIKTDDCEGNDDTKINGNLLNEINPNSEREAENYSNQAVDFRRSDASSEFEQNFRNNKSKPSPQSCQKQPEGVLKTDDPLSIQEIDAQNISQSSGGIMKQANSDSDALRKNYLYSKESSVYFKQIGPSSDQLTKDASGNKFISEMVKEKSLNSDFDNFRANLELLSGKDITYSHGQHTKKDVLGNEFTNYTPRSTSRSMSNLETASQRDEFHSFTSSPNSTSSIDRTLSGFSFLKVSDISLKTQPSKVPPPSRPPPGRPPPKLGSERRPSFHSFKSPSVDKGSIPTTTAASVAAVQEAMELAQARLRTAKVSLERKRSSLQSRMKFGSSEELSMKVGDGEIHETTAMGSMTPELNSGRGDKGEWKVDEEFFEFVRGKSKKECPSVNAETTETKWTASKEEFICELGDKNNLQEEAKKEEQRLGVEEENGGAGEVGKKLEKEREKRWLEGETKEKEKLKVEERREREELSEEGEKRRLEEEKRKKAKLEEEERVKRLLEEREKDRRLLEEEQEREKERERERRLLEEERERERRLLEEERERERRLLEEEKEREREKRLLEEEEEREKERRLLAEEKKKREKERKLLEEEEEKKERERKLLEEEEKRERERRLLEEEKKRETERKALEEEKRERERRLLEEEKKREIERKLIEEEKKKLEEEARRRRLLEEEAKKMKDKLEEEARKRRLLEEEKRKEMEKLEEEERNKRLLEEKKREKEKIEDEERKKRQLEEEREKHEEEQREMRRLEEEKRQQKKLEDEERERRRLEEEMEREKRFREDEEGERKRLELEEQRERVVKEEVRSIQKIETEGKKPEERVRGRWKIEEERMKFRKFEAVVEGRDKHWIEGRETEDKEERERRMLEEERDREREREKDRQAAERAAREANERAVAEARERAERAAAMEKSLASKARVRAEKSTLEGRGPGDNKTTTSSAPSGSEMGESAIRSKAKMERHQRTVERAAKALAEKNMRDVIAQREQAERNRLAETLDAEIRRWSNGKEGNLRALLSTLQYILGPESGWQPVQLTEVLTAQSVKRAYRKATLCVHPDKLQQRGASIQHKYICEKVFDLLKEAWTKFNSEER